MMNILDLKDRRSIFDFWMNYMMGKKIYQIKKVIIDIITFLRDKKIKRRKKSEKRKRF